MSIFFCDGCQKLTDSDYYGYNLFEDEDICLCDRCLDRREEDQREAEDITENDPIMRRHNFLYGGKK